MLKTGLFLLFIVALAVLTPVQSSASGNPFGSRPAEVKTDYSEIREHHLTRPSKASGREDSVPAELPLLPKSFHGPADPGKLCPTVAGDSRASTRQHECVHSRHSPAVLQVFRH